jgi:DNA-binding XRE family transcriptional regulator
MTKLSRKRLSLDEKVKVLKFIKAGNSQATAAVKFNVSRPTVVKIVKEAEQIVQKCKGSNSSSKIVKTRAKCELVEVMLHSWHMRVEIDAPDLNVTGDVLKTKAIHFRDLILERHGDSLPQKIKSDLESFKASNGWLDNYKHRVQTTSIRRCGEHSSTDPVTIEERMKVIRDMLIGVPIENIFNMDESALQHRTTSSRSYVTVNSDKRGVKRSKERITFTPLVSASGEKLELQVIGKSKSPRTLKGIDIDQTFG